MSDKPFLSDVTDLTKQLTDAYGTLMPIIPPGLSKDGKFYAVPFFSSSDASAAGRLSSGQE